MGPVPHASKTRYVVAEATSHDRQQIARLRHEIYSDELGQHPSNSKKELQDDLDAHNRYIVVRTRDGVIGFISITLPDARSFSIDKYFRREDIPCTIHDKTFELRLLTVREHVRGTNIASLLVYAAYRWIMAHGAKRIVAIGRTDLLPFYERLGMQRTGLTAVSGALKYEFMWADDDLWKPKIKRFAAVIQRFERKYDWSLPFPFSQPAPCFHGGQFFSAVGERFDTLEKSKVVINADVLDAWFDPAPEVLSTVSQYLPWLIKTSPPTQCDGLIDVISDARCVPRDSILPGAGSSDLIFRAFLTFLNRKSRVLILDPTYGEYAHVLENVIGCHVDRFTLRRTEGYRADLAQLEHCLQKGFDLIVLVNPNSPTGQHIKKSDLTRILRKCPALTRVWIDETYIDYIGKHESLESYAARSENVIVCKSMSKVYALSGARIGYLCAAPVQLETLRSLSPPWAVGLPSQVAAVCALKAPDYYAMRYEETHTERKFLANSLRALGWEVIDGVANFLLCHLPESGPTAERLIAHCRQNNVFIRNASNMSPSLGPYAVRIAIRSSAENMQVLDTISSSYH